MFIQFLHCQYSGYDPENVTRDVLANIAFRLQRSIFVKSFLDCVLIIGSLYLVISSPALNTFRSQNFRTIYALCYSLRLTFHTFLQRCDHRETNIIGV